MKLLEQHLSAKEKYTNYQIKQIIYVVKTISSDISKVIFLTIIFWNHLPAYLVALMLLFLLRSFSGGLHFDTYLRCLAVTAGYLFLSILVLPCIAIAFEHKILLLIVCMIACDRLGVVTSKYRPPLSAAKIAQCRNIILFVILGYILLLYIMPLNQYITVGFWVIILHTVQLAIAKAIRCISQKKGETASC